MKTPEADLKDKVKKYLSEIPNLFFWMPVPTGYGMRGIPDFVGCYRGIFFGIETKAPKGKETPWQERVRNQIFAAGGFSIVAYDMEEVTCFIQQLIRLASMRPVRRSE